MMFIKQIIDTNEKSVLKTVHALNSTKFGKNWNVHVSTIWYCKIKQAVLERVYNIPILKLHEMLTLTWCILLSNYKHIIPWEF